MGRKIQPATFPGTAPVVRSEKYADAQTFKTGALLVFSSGELVECGSDPATIHGVALEPAGSKLGYDMADSPVVVTGRVQEVSYAVVDRMTEFSGRMINGATDPVTPAQTDVGVAYGVAKTGDDWVVDQAETGNARVRITRVDIDNKIVFFKFLEANIGAL